MPSTYFIEIVDPQKAPGLPLRTPLEVLSFNHVERAGTPSMTVAGPSGPVTIKTEAARILSGVELHDLRLGLKRARRALAREG